MVTAHGHCGNIYAPRPFHAGSVHALIVRGLLEQSQSVLIWDEDTPDGKTRFIPLYQISDLGKQVLNQFWHDGLWEDV